MIGITPKGFPRGLCFSSSVGGGPKKLFIGTLVKEFTARISRPPARADFQDDFLFSVATDVYYSGKRALAALGTVFQMKAHITETQEATRNDNFTFLMDNTMGRNAPHLEPLDQEGLSTSHAFQLLLIEEEYVYKNIPPHMQLSIAKIRFSAINLSAFNTQYYLFALDKAYAAEKQDINQALLWLKIAILLNPDIPSSYAEAGFLYAQLGEFQKALEMYDQLVKLLPNEGRCYLQRGIYHAQTQNLAAAQVDLKRALELDPSLIQAKLYLISIYAQQGTEVGALDKMLALAEELPLGQKSQAFSIIASFYAKRGNFKQAAVYAQKEVDDDPETAESYFNLSIALMDLEEYEKALKNVEICLSMNTDLRIAYLQKAHLLLLLNRTQEAISFCRDTIFRGQEISGEAILAFLTSPKPESGLS